MNDIVSRLEDAAATLMQAEPGDQALFARLHQQFEDLARLLELDSQELPARMASRSAAMLGECARGESGDASRTLEVVSRGISALYSVVRDGQPMTESSMPIEFQSTVAPEAKVEPAHGKLLTPAAESEVYNPFMDADLLAGFIGEAQEHLESADNQLLVLENDPGNQESLNCVFRAFHTIKGVSGILNLQKIAAISHEAESLLDLARNHEITLAGPAMDAVFAAVDALKRLVGDIRPNVPLSDDLQADQPLLKLIASIQKIATHRDSAADGAIDREGVIASEGSPVGNAQHAAAMPETLKVDRNRLDRLVDMIGELVIAESMVHQHLMSTSANLVLSSRNLGQLNKITRKLQELSLSLRMVPVRATFQKMARLVRDLSKKLNKQIDFVMTGEDTELDKTVVDQIGDPLVHMLRNSLDHGVETPAERIAAGKTPRGTITVRAYHQGGNINIEIEDDGRGLNRERILAKAKERGLVAEDAQLTDREIYNLIFEPGFSTAEKITDVSGRGVGMDVVRRNVEAMRGSVELRSEPGKGSCFAMRLPLTLAIIDGMVVRVGENRYIIPTLSIVELLRPQSKDLSTVCGKAEVYTIRGRHLPLIRVARVFTTLTETEDATDAIVAVVEDGANMAGLVVDEVLGQQQVVIKTLGNSLEGQPGISGGAIMPDGNVGLILDIHGLLELAQSARARQPELATT